MLKYFRKYSNFIVCTNIYACLSLVIKIKETLKNFSSTISLVSFLIISLKFKFLPMLLIFDIVNLEKENFDLHMFVLIDFLYNELLFIYF